MTLQDLLSGHNNDIELGLYVVWKVKRKGGLTGISAILMIYSEREGLYPFDNDLEYENPEWVDETPEHEIMVQFVEEL